MAGIGFQLKKMLATDNYIGLIGAFAYAGIITSGPWLIAIITILTLAIFTRGIISNLHLAQTFQSIIVYLIAGSLILSSVFHHSYTRYIADIYYKNEIERILPTLNGIYTVILMTAAIIGYIGVNIFIPDVTHFIKIITVSCLIILCMIWVTTSVLSGLLAYRTIFAAFISSYFVSIALGYFLVSYGLPGLLFSFTCGQFILLMMLIFMVYKFYPSDELVSYHFFSSGLIKKALLFSGLFYNIAIWIDKFIFWFSPITGTAVFENLHQSFIYDTPIFLAYLAVIPGTIAFLLHIETDFADAYEDFYNSVRGDSTLAEINAAYSQLMSAGRDAVNSILKAQLYLLLVGITLGTSIFVLAHISIVYLPLFYICLLAASLNVVFWATLDIVFYLDKIRVAAFLTGLFMVSNGVLTWLSIQLGIFYYGYGLLTSLFITVMVNIIILNGEFKRLRYETYMLTSM